MRVLVPRGSAEAGKRVDLDENEAHHLRVRRAGDRESVEVLDGAGLRGTGRLRQTGRNWSVDIESVEFQERPTQMTLAVAAGDRDRFSWMVEKSVELGVTGIIPLETSRSAGVATRLKDSHIRRLRQSAMESIKQCGAAWAPSVEDVVPLAQFLERSRSGNGWLADREGSPAPAFLNLAPVTVVIGPEGGLTGEELAALRAAGYQPVVLGSHTLRFETAALAAAAAVNQARLRGQHG
jgi:16S rRNA (uracil1498-N3)-methyltransferase